MRRVLQSAVVPADCRDGSAGVLFFIISLPNILIN
jgi:hypothetical protein